jgi:hypothetical protein
VKKKLRAKIGAPAAKPEYCIAKTSLLTIFFMIFHELLRNSAICSLGENGLDSRKKIRSRAFFTDSMKMRHTRQSGA